MVTIFNDSNFICVEITLSRNAFNKELLKKQFNIVCESKNEVKSLLKSNNFKELSSKIDEFLTISKILKLY